MRAAVKNDTAVRADEMRETRGLAPLIAEAALEWRADSALATIGLERPRLREERRPVVHVLLMAAGELGDPLALCVYVEADDRTVHPIRVRGAARVTACAPLDPASASC